MRHFVYVPFTGLGLYGGFRGNRWLKNRIRVFLHFVVPSLLAQTNQDWVLWVSWRPEERHNRNVQELYNTLVRTLGEERVVFTYHGVCFWDDKYPDEAARSRLMKALHGSLAQLINYVGDVEHVLMTIQPSDDCYKSTAFADIQEKLSGSIFAMGYTKGYLMNYQTKQLLEYNPKTNPPFFTIKFTKEDFIDPFRHAQHTGPYKSHEYIGDHIPSYTRVDERGFLVGTHGENISTHFNHPYGGDTAPEHVLSNFGILETEPLRIRYSWRKALLRRLPHRVQRKLRFIFGERLFARIYEFLRN